jgi:RNA polymerase sigma-70 factor, ECF subfamily
MSDAEAFEAFVRRYQDMVFATAVRLLGSPAEAEDVAQAVFLRAFERFTAIGSSPAAAGWLRTVTRNVCLNHLSRYRSRLRFFSELDSSEGGWDGEADYAAGIPAAATVEAGRYEELERALWRLPDHQRVPLVLFHYDDMSYQEIADLLRISLGKVKTDMHRGREALKRVLARTR